MARDHALARALTPGQGVLRFYRWAQPTLSFGRNEPTVGLWRKDLLEGRGIAVVRRPTGGRAVLHHRELTYAVVVPLGDRRALRSVYAAVNRALTRGLSALGVPARMAPAAGRSLPPDAGPCFQAPAEGEVTASGRKIVGSAQVRLGAALLQHGSILMADDQSLLAELRRDGGAEGPPPATLEGVLGRAPELDDLHRALIRAFAAEFGGDWPDDASPGTLAPEMVEGEEELLVRYASPEWTWRR